MTDYRGLSSGGVYEDRLVLCLCFSRVRALGGGVMAFAGWPSGLSGIVVVLAVAAALGWWYSSDRNPN